MLTGTIWIQKLKTTKCCISKTSDIKIHNKDQRQLR